jgi:predicted acylesterase/phospholipase RssA
MAEDIFVDPGVVVDPNNYWDLQPVVRRQGRALVLTGGGALGAFQVGAIKRLWESGYRPDLICGISVGAINAVKLAEGDENGATAAEKLEGLWNQLADGSLQILHDWAGAEALKKRVDGLLTAHGVGVTAAASIPPPFDVPAVGAWLSQLPGVVTDSAIAEASRVHALHSLGGELPGGFRGLIELARERIRPDLIAQSGIQLRIGMVDLESGSLWMATGPEPVGVYGADGDVIQEFRSRLEREPDLSRPITDPDHSRYIDLAWATYASTVMPLYFPPVEASEVQLPGGGFDVRCSLASDFRSILRGENAQPSGSRAPWKHFFDGGLADIVPIRTAMRLGCREITVISNSPLHKNEWAWAEPDPRRAEHTPLLQYLNGFIGCWSANVARSDLLLALAYNEFLGWIYRLNTLLPPEQARGVREQFEAYWRERRPHWENLLGTTTWLGGRVPMNPADVGFEFGRPFVDEGCQIRVIAPEHPLPVDVLGFTDAPNLRLTMNRGYERMSALLNDDRPSQLSFPVQDNQRMTRRQARERGLLL